MQRRSFLKTTFALPVWLAAVARGQNTPPTGAGETDLERAWEAARRTARPLLVLVVPPPKALEPGEAPSIHQSGERDLRGEAWAQYVQYGSDEALADLSLCVVACATLAEAWETLAERGGAALPLGGDPLALLVESDLSAVESIDLTLSTLVWHRMPDESWEAARAEYERRVRERVASMESALRAVLAPNPYVLEDRAARARRALPDLPERVSLSGADEELRVLAERAPAVVRVAAEWSPRRAEAIATLAELTRTRALAEAPAGALWGEATGCGVRIEGLVDTTTMVMCGMGHVPRMGRRFLHFYTAS